ncbi:MAG: 2-isopropylmalate synthase [Bacteroidota bacterium]
MASSKVFIFDTTLRDGEQAPGASMHIDEKVRIAQRLALLGVDVLEAGFPVSSPGQAEAVRQVVAALTQPHDPVVCALARAVDQDIAAAGDALQGGARTRIHTFIATSDIHIDAKFGHAKYGASLAEKRATVLRMIDQAVRHARTYTADVEFSAEDAGRTDLGFLCEALQVAADAGATTLNIPDTTGYCVPHEVEALFRAVRGCLSAEHADIILSAHCHDDLGLAVANSLAAVRGGARQIECTINGIGERAGNASLEEVVMALRVRGDEFGVHADLDTTGLFETSRLVSVSCGFPVPPNKAIVGRNAFSHEAGIHQDGVLKRRDTYEIMRAEDVGQQSEQIRLGRHSGRHGVFRRIEALGYDLDMLDPQALYQAFTRLADQKKEVFDKDLRHLVDAHVAAPSEDRYHLEQVSVQMATGTQPQASVTLSIRPDGQTLSHTATGDGPVEALYNALDHALGTAHDLASYTIRSVTEGADAIGEVDVTIHFAGQSFSGQARSTDVIQASAEAYMTAINRMDQYQTESKNVAFVGRGIMESFQ